MMVASLSPSGTRVLDIGAGNQNLKEALRPGCTYFPADLVPGPGVRHVDLESSLPLDLGQYDVAVLSGVLEHLTDPARALDQVKDVAPLLVVTYATKEKRVPENKKSIWVSNMTETELCSVFKAMGSQIVVKKCWQRQTLYLLSLACPQVEGSSPG